LTTAHCVQDLRAPVCADIMVAALAPLNCAVQLFHPREISPMPPDNERLDTASSTIESGRVRVCGGLLVSVNRSWQVPPKQGSRPAAAFKSMAPIAPDGAAGSTGRAGDNYLAAVAGHDAFWLGFEVDDGQSFAVIPFLDARAALTGRQSQSDALEYEPRNFLVVPDQPWFDCVVGSDGSFQQLVPGFASAAATAGRAQCYQCRLVIYALDAAATQLAAAPEPDGPVPLYSQGSAAAGTETSVHAWSGRDMRSDHLTSRQCAVLTFVLLEPDVFQKRSSIELPPGMFDDAEGAPPLPHNPFAAS
jgi:hypothetical protein